MAGKAAAVEFLSDAVDALGAADDDHFAAFFQQSFGHAVSQSPGAARDDGFLPLNIESIQLVYSGLSLFVAGLFGRIGVQVVNRVNQSLAGEVVGHVGNVPTLAVDLVYQSADALVPVFRSQAQIMGADRKTDIPAEGENLRKAGCHSARSAG